MNFAKLNRIAWAIREQAALAHNCQKMAISWRECLQLAKEVLSDVVADTAAEIAAAISTAEANFAKITKKEYFREFLEIAYVAYAMRHKTAALAALVQKLGIEATPGNDVRIKAISLFI